MFCTNCGTQFEGNFCPNCGTPAYQAPYAQPAPPAAQVMENIPFSMPYGYPNGLTEEDLEKMYRFAQGNEESMGCQLFVNFDLSPEQATLIVKQYLATKNKSKKPSFLAACTVGELPARLGKKHRFPNNYDRAIFRGKDPHEMARIFKKEMWETRVAENEANGIFGCPKCGSTNVLCEGRDFSVGAAAAGGILMGDVGMLAGVGSGKNLTFSCLECGEHWKFRTR